MFITCGSEGLQSAGIIIKYRESCLHVFNIEWFCFWLGKLTENENQSHFNEIWCIKIAKADERRIVLMPVDRLDEIITNNCNQLRINYGGSCQWIFSRELLRKITQIYWLECNRYWGQNYCDNNNGWEGNIA